MRQEVEELRADIGVAEHCEEADMLKPVLDAYVVMFFAENTLISRRAFFLQRKLHEHTLYAVHQSEPSASGRFRPSFKEFTGLSAL